MTQQATTEKPLASAAPRRSLGLLIGLTALLIIAGAGVSVLAPEWSRPLAFLLLGLLAMVGVVALFVFASGLAGFHTPLERSDFAPFDHSPDAVVAVDRQGRAAGTRRLERPSPADRFVHLPRPDRSRQERADQVAGAFPVRQ